MDRYDVYVIIGTAKIGHEFRLDEWADREYATFELAMAGAREAEGELRNRYRAAKIRCHAGTRIARDAAAAKMERIRAKYQR